MRDLVYGVPFLKESICGGSSPADAELKKQHLRERCPGRMSDRESGRTSFQTQGQFSRGCGTLIGGGVFGESEDKDAGGGS